MRLKTSWLFLSPLLTPALGVYLGHNGPVFNAVSEFERYTQGEQQPVFSGEIFPSVPLKQTATIYDTLANDPRFSLVTKAINFVEEIASLLKDPSSNLTFFAPPDRVLRPPPGASGPPHRNSTFIHDLLNDPITYDSSTILRYGDFSEMLPFLDNLSIDATSSRKSYSDKRKKIAKIILRAILSYHIVPAAYDVISLANNVTYPTILQIPGAFDGQPLRLRITHSAIPPITHINVYTKIIRPDIDATNGVVHVVDHAILPPPSAFQELYMVPRYFSTFTSALQRSGLTPSVDLRFAKGKGLEGAPLVTIFAPTNGAFEKLPKRLQLFLFSPFGERVLKKLLQYHIVPDAAVFSNYIHGKYVVNPKEDHQQNPRFPIHAEPIFSTNLTLNTLLLNRTVSIYVTQKKFTFPKLPGHQQPFLIDTRVYVNQHSTVVSDIVSLNGAIHVIDKLLDPRKVQLHGHHHHRHHELEEVPKRGGPIVQEQSSPNGRRACAHSRGSERPNKQKHHIEGHLAHIEPEFVFDAEGHYNRDHYVVNDEAHLKDDVWSDWESWLPQWAEEV